MPLSCRLKLYNAFVSPHIIYGVEVYANTFKTYLKKLSTLNNKIIRILNNKSIFMPVAQLYKSVNVLPILELHDLKILTLIYKCVHHKNLLPEVFHNYVTRTSTVHVHNLRRHFDLFVPRSRSNFGKRSSLFKGCVLWNSIPIEIKSNSSLTMFKKSVFNMLFESIS